MAIIFDEIAHTYTDSRTGEQAPSVNHIINEVYGSGLEFVNKKILAERAEYGKGVHAEINWIIKNGLKPTTTKYPETKVFLQLAEMKGLKIYSPKTTSEGIIYVPGMFAGTADLICNGILWDYKTSKNKPTRKMLDHWQKQLSFYYYGLKYLGHEPEGMSIIHLHNLEARTYPLKYLGDKFVIETVQAYQEGRKINETPQALANIDRRSVAKLEKTLKKIALLEQEIKPIREKIKNEMEAHGITAVELGSVSVTYVAPGKRKSLDTAKLKEEKPAIYEKYLKETTVASSIRIKVNEHRDKKEENSL